MPKQIIPCQIQVMSVLANNSPSKTKVCPELMSELIIPLQTQGMSELIIPLQKQG